MSRTGVYWNLKFQFQSNQFLYNNHRFFFGFKIWPGLLIFRRFLVSHRNVIVGNDLRNTTAVHSLIYVSVSLATELVTFAWTVGMWTQSCHG